MKLEHDCDDSQEFDQLLVQARQGHREARGQLLQWYLNYLTILATSQLNQPLRRRVSPSDLVQEAMLAAYRDFGDFRGNSRGELLGWLRQILINTLHRAFATHVKAEKRDIRREISLDQTTQRMDESGGNLARLLPSSSPSPSAPMRSREDAVLLADQLNRLRPDYRDVVVLRVIQGLSFQEIADQMNRSSGAVRMLFLRALNEFKATNEPSVHR